MASIRMETRRFIGLLSSLLVVVVLLMATLCHAALEVTITEPSLSSYSETQSPLPVVRGIVSDNSSFVFTVEVQIFDSITGSYWNSIDWGTLAVWNPVSFTGVQWQYLPPHWIVGHNYIIQIKATNDKGEVVFSDLRIFSFEQ